MFILYYRKLNRNYNVLSILTSINWRNIIFFIVESIKKILTKNKIIESFIQ